MSYQNVFKRYELKYMLNAKQKAAVLKAMEEHMKIDKYGRTTIRNIYFDTDDFRLIRTSIDKPVYKEKLRVRSYGKAGEDDNVFVELKKKYDSVVYKRRISVPKFQAEEWLSGKSDAPFNSQITNEIDYFLSFYRGLAPKCFLSYEREAYYALDGSDFRVTFDENIISRYSDLDLGSEVYGDRVIDSDMTLMELKISGAMPLWMAECLSEAGIRRTSFSKYGISYKQMMEEKARITTLGGYMYA